MNIHSYERVNIMDYHLKVIKDNLINSDTKHKVSLLFKAIADPTRMNILFALKNHSLSVSELILILDMSQSAVSHQLRVLRANNLVVYEKKGKEVYYTLSDMHVHEIFNQAIDHVEEEGN